MINMPYFDGFGGSVIEGKEALRNWVWARCPRGSYILDIGCGGGTWYEVFKTSGYIMDGVDIDNDTIAYVINKYRTLYQMSIMNFKFRQNYDLVIFGDVLEHLNIPDAQKVLTEALLHTRYLFVAVPYLCPQEPWEPNPYEEHLQPDLTPEIMQQRYPQLQLLLEIKKDDGFWYGYYVAKGDLNE